MTRTQFKLAESVLHSMEAHHPELKAAISKAEAAGVSWLTILMTALPMLIQLLTGGKFDINTLIQAILALIGK